MKQMKENLIHISYIYWTSHTTKWFQSLDIPYLKELKQIYWEDAMIPYLNSDKVLTGLEHAMSDKVLPEYRQTEEEWIKTLTENYLLTFERSYQIYLDPTDPLNEKNTKLNGHIYNRYVTKAKREWQLNNLFISL